MLCVGMQTGRFASSASRCGVRGQISRSSSRGGRTQGSRSIPSPPEHGLRHRGREASELHSHAKRGNENMSEYPQGGDGLIRFVHQYPKFSKQLDSLRAAEKKAAIAAKKADRIIANLIQGHIPSQTGRLSKNGELRLRKCMKYDLGCGYRLITIRQGHHLCLSYIGTHDECDRWIENNRKHPLTFQKSGSRTFSVQQPASLKSSGHQAENDEDENFPDSIDDKYLRIIFRGLCSG